jgi:predicted transcriptional regulator
MKKKIIYDQCYYVLDDKQQYFAFVKSIDELAQVLHRSKHSVKESIKRIHKNKQEFILKDKNRNKYVIISQEELGRGKCINES